jgi:putative ABC transport system permease protein
MGHKRTGWYRGCSLNAPSPLPTKFRVGFWGLTMLDEFWSAMAGSHNNDGAGSGTDDNHRSTKGIAEDKNGAHADNVSVSDIENHADRLFKLLNELRSLTERACDAALREAESADTIEETLKAEIAKLRVQLEQKDEFVAAAETALAGLEETAAAKLAELENLIQDKDQQLDEQSIQLHRLTSERNSLISRSKEAEVAVKEAQSQARQFTERLEAERAELRLQVATREESLEAKEAALNKTEGDLRTNIQNLQLRLQDTEVNLVKRERELKEKDNVIQAAAVREREIGKLIQRLSSECEKLTAEVCEKGLVIAQLEDKTRQSTNGGKVWKKVLGLAPEKPL